MARVSTFIDTERKQSARLFGRPTARERGASAILAELSKLVDRRSNSGRISAHDLIRAFSHGDRTFGVLSKRQAGDSEYRGFFLDSSGIGKHKTSVVHERQEVEITERVDDGNGP